MARKAEKESIPTSNWISMPEEQKSSSGFTMLELTAVMFIMIILLGVSLPNFSNMLESNLEKETRRIAAIIGELRLQAILKSENYQLLFDTKKSEYQVFTTDPLDSTNTDPHDKYDSPIKLSPPVEFSKISTEIEEETTSRRFGGEKLEFEKIFGQHYIFRIDSSGFIDLFTLKLKDDSNSITLTIKNIMGDISISQEEPL
jgi:type II secretory pathway pseudopilin PulG